MDAVRRRRADDAAGAIAKAPTERKTTARITGVAHHAREARRGEGFDVQTCLARADGDRARHRFRRKLRRRSRISTGTRTSTFTSASAPAVVYDINARLLSRFMGRHIPGNPTLVPRNMVGAAGVTARELALSGRPEGRDRNRHVRARHRVQSLARSARRGRSRRRNSTGSAAPTTRSPSARRGARAESQNLSSFRPGAHHRFDRQQRR